MEIAAATTTTHKIGKKLNKSYKASRATLLFLRGIFATPGLLSEIVFAAERAHYLKFHRPVLVEAQLLI